jgi:excisionase family DNA binding protein
VTDELASALLGLLAPAIERMIDERLTERLAAHQTQHGQPDVWMSTEEAAIYLCLSPPALRARVRRGTVPAHRDGRRLLYHRDELDRSVDGYHPASHQQDGPARLAPPGPWPKDGGTHLEAK